MITHKFSRKRRGADSYFKKKRQKINFASKGERKEGGWVEKCMVKGSTSNERLDVTVGRGRDGFCCVLWEVKRWWMRGRRERK